MQSVSASRPIMASSVGMYNSSTLHWFHRPPTIPDLQWRWKEAMTVVSLAITSACGRRSPTGCATGLQKLREAPETSPQVLLGQTVHPGA